MPAETVGRIRKALKGYIMDTNFDLMGSATGTAATTETQNADGMVFNLTDVKESVAFEVIPKGTYDAVIEELEFTHSQSSNAPMIHVVYSIVGGEYEGRKVHDYNVLTGKGAEYSLPRLRQLLSRVCPEVDLSAFNPQAFAESGVAINRQCQIKLAVSTQKQGEYKGEKRNNVREVLSSSEIANSFLG